MIARSWRGAVRTADAEAYADYIDETGMKDTPPRPATAAPGCSPEIGDLTEFVTFSLWDSSRPSRPSPARTTRRAVFYPEDDRYLVERDPSCTPLGRRARAPPASMARHV